jgi:hypothetical protein
VALKTFSFFSLISNPPKGEQKKREEFLPPFFKLKERQKGIEKGRIQDPETFHSNFFHKNLFSQSLISTLLAYPL